MIEVKRLTKYDEKIAAEMGKLAVSLSSKDPGTPIDKKWMEDIIASPWHDQLLAFDDDKLVGMATMSIVMGSHIGRYKSDGDVVREDIGRNAYLEDLVVSKECQGKGVGGVLWDAIVAWGREKKARRLEFSSSGQEKKGSAVGFYLHKGAKIRETNFFRIELQG